MVVVGERMSDGQKTKDRLQTLGKIKGAGTMTRQKGERHQRQVDAGPRKS